MSRPWSLTMQAQADGTDVGTPETPIIMTDARPDPVPTIKGLKWITDIDRTAMEEASFLQSLFEGVSHQEGQRRVEQYQREKQQALQIEAATRGGGMTGHGFRGVALTILHEQGYNHEHIELHLAHVPRNAVSAAYNHALYL